MSTISQRTRRFARRNHAERSTRHQAYSYSNSADRWSTVMSAQHEDVGTATSWDFQPPPLSVQGHPVALTYRLQHANGQQHTESPHQHKRPGTEKTTITSVDGASLSLTDCVVPALTVSRTKTTYWRLIKITSYGFHLNFIITLVGTILTMVETAGLHNAYSTRCSVSHSGLYKSAMQSRPTIHYIQHY